MNIFKQGSSIWDLSLLYSNYKNRHEILGPSENESDIFQGVSLNEIMELFPPKQPKNGMHIQKLKNRIMTCLLNIPVINAYVKKGKKNWPAFLKTWGAFSLPGSISLRLN